MSLTQRAHPVSLSRRALLAGGAAAALARPAAAALSYDLRPVEVADGLFMVEGAREYFTRANGGAIVNVAVLRTSVGAVVFDTGSTRRYGEALRDLAHGLSPLGVAAVIVSHHHPDHWFGNQAFADRPIHALGPTAAACRARGDDYADGLYRDLGDWMRGTEPVPPTRAAPTGRFAIGDRAFTALPLAGHTGADLALLDERTGVALTGDLAFLDRAPTVPDADLPRWRESLELLTQTAPSAILPGHGPFDRARRALTQTRDYLDWIDAHFAAAADAGLSQPEAMALAPPPRQAALAEIGGEYERAVLQAYPRYQRAATPLLR